MKIVPNLRFQQFSDEWNFSILDSVCTINPRAKELPNDFYYIDLESVEKGMICDVSIINKSNAPSRAQRVLSVGDILFQTVRPYQQNNYFFKEENKIPTVASTGYAQIRAHQNNKFLYYLLHTSNFNKNVLIRCTGSNYPAINSTDLSEIDICLPSIEEQEKIASFFSLIDKKIELQTEKVEELKNYKKGIMQKLFPRNGEDIPELRFTGYINDWEHRKISDIFPEIKSGNRLPKTSLSKGTIPYVIAQVTNNGIYMNIDVNTKDYHGNSMKLFNVPCITLSIDNPKAMFIQTTPFYTSNIMRILHNSELELEHYHFILEQIKLLVTYFDWSFKFSGPVIMESKILVPINAGEIDFNEIKKIGSMILQFNNLIDLHQCKLDALIKYKKGLLQQMFI